MASRREVIEAVRGRYQASGRDEKKKILDEVIEVTGVHRKHAIRVLRKGGQGEGERSSGPRARVYDEAVKQALIVLWEAADRICGKRLKQLVPALVAAMEGHGHLELDAEVRRRLLEMSAATMDRLLRPVREGGKQGRRRPGNNTALRNSIRVRTFGDWRDPAPGYFEMDMVAHCGRTVAGSHLHSLVLTDIATGWTEGVALLVREQTFVARMVEEIRGKLPFPMLGLDVDNDGAFINETLVAYCRERKLELTRCRAYKKNDQAWIEQKNGAVVRRLVGYGRLEGVEAAAVLARLHEAARLYVNFFQPSFKLLSKTREGAKVTKKYERPATPCERLLASDRTSDAIKDHLRSQLKGLDPVELLSQIRNAQRRLVELEVVGGTEGSPQPSVDLSRFVGSLAVAWRDGEVRPTHRKRVRGPRTWRTRIDPFEKVWVQVEDWLEQDPGASAKELFTRLCAEQPESFQPGQLRTLQRRVKEWRSQMVQALIMGSTPPTQAEVSVVTGGGAALGGGTA